MFGRTRLTRQSRMIRLPRLLTAACAMPLLLALPTDATAAPGAGWHTPACDTIRGADGSVSYTVDDGRSITATDTRLTPVTYTHLATLTDPDAMVAISQHQIRRSSDAGCNWRSLLKVPENLAAYDVAAGADGIAYVFGINEQPIYRVDGQQVLARSGPVAGDGVRGLAADPDDPDTLIAVDVDGQIHRSVDGAGSWTAVGVPAVANGRDLYVYSAAIDRTDPDHVVVGGGSFSAVTTDGGHTWHQVTGLTDTQTNKRTNVFSVAISPLDPSVVWAEGYDMGRTGLGVRRIWRSTDGGHTFHGVLDGTQVDLVNGTDLYPSPWDTDVLYFTFGMAYAGYGTDLYRVDVSASIPMWQRLSSHHNDYDGIDSIAFHPENPRVLYLGLSEER